MNNLKTYIRKNAVFVSILSVFLVIILGIGVFYVMQNTDSDEAPKTKPTTNQTNKKTKTSIATFSGYFGGEDSIILSWSLSEGSSRVQRLELYRDKNILADVSSLLSYELPLSAYQLTTGNNHFTLKAYLQDGTEISKDADVLVDFVLHASHTITPTEGGQILNLNYRYGTANPVGVPSISFTYGTNGDARAASVAYRTTTYETFDSLFTQANTSYFLDTSKLADGEYSMNFRYFFKDVDESYDFTVTFTVNKVVPPVSGETPPTNSPEIEEPTTPDDTNPDVTN